MYKVHLDKDLENPWAVVEMPTSQIIASYDDSREAKIQANILNGGHGFRGHTPAYLLERLVLA
jgi:hypothetical protein